MNRLPAYERMGELRAIILGRIDRAQAFLAKASASFVGLDDDDLSDDDNAFLLFVRASDELQKALAFEKEYHEVYEEVDRATGTRSQAEWDEIFAKRQKPTTEGGVA